MSLAHPWALALLLLLPLLWLVRQEPPRRRILVSGTFLWPASSRREPTLGARLRRHDLLWIQTGLLTALIVALAGPRLESSPDTVAIVVDTSLSMGARDGQGTRLDTGRNRVLDALDAAGWRGPVRVWAAGASPSLAGTAAPGAALESVLEAVAVSDGWANLESAVARARQDGASRVFVVTDAANQGGGVDWLTVGDAVDNLAVTSVTVTPAPERDERARVLVEVRNFGRTDARAELAVALGEAETLHALEIDAGGTGAVSLDVPDLAPGTIVSAVLHADDGLEADNVRRTVAPRRRRIRIAVAGRSPFLEAALAAHPSVERVSSRTDPHDLLLCLDCPRGVDGEAATLVAFTAEPGQAMVPITVTRPDHPVLAGVPLDGVLVSPVTRPDDAGDGLVAARAGDRPAVVVYESTAGRSVELRFDLMQAGLALEPAFPLLVANIVDTLGPMQPPLAVRAGDAWEWHRRGPRTAATVTGPSGRGVPVQAMAEGLLVSATATAGVYRVDTGAERLTFVVNPATTESDLSSPATPTPRSAEATDTTRAVASEFDVAPLVLALALVLIVWESHARLMLARHAGRTLAWPRAAARGTAIVLVLAAIAGLPIWTGTAPLAVSFALDMSASSAVNGRAWMDKARALARTFGPDDRAGLTVFAESAMVERRVQVGGLPATTEGTVRPSATDIERGLQAARASLPQEGDRRIVLFSDGRQTSGDALREARLAAGDGVRIDVMPPLGAMPAAARATRVIAPAVVRLDEPFEVRVVVEGEAGTEGTLRLTGPGGVETRALVVPGAGATTAVFMDRAPGTGVRTYRASYVPELFGDGDEAFTEAGAVVSVTGRPRGLYLGDRFGALAPALSAAGFAADSLRLPAVPASGLDPYDAVILDDADPLALSPGLRGALSRYVEAGGGLLVLGSERSLPPSSGDPAYDELLPVDPRPRGGERGSAMALVVAFDKSGSMDERVGGTQKIEFARQAVRNVAAALPAGDALGVIAFDSQPVPVAALGQPRATQLDAALRALRPEGATAIAPALSQAAGWLNAGTFDRKHVLLVSDGQTFAGDLARARQLVQEGGFVLSVVALGAGPDRAALDALATGSGGRAYFVDDVRTLPTAVAREAIRVGGGRVVDSSFEARLGGHALTSGLEGTPRLGGYVVTALRPGADAVLRSHLDDPVLAVGRSGLGRVAVYTADLHSVWSASLIQWQGFGALLARTLRWLSRSAETAGLHASLRATPTSVVVDVEVDGGTGLAAVPLDVRGVLRSPAGDNWPLVFTAAAPGRYAATAPVGTTGGYVATLSASATDGSLQATAVRGMYYAAPQEHDVAGTDLALLQQIASTTGGQLLPPAVATLEGREAGFRDGRPWFAAAALLALFGDFVLAGLPHLLLGVIRRVGAQEQLA